MCDTYVYVVYILILIVCAPLFALAVVHFELRPSESLFQAVDALENLNKVVSEVLNRISTKVTAVLAAAHARACDAVASPSSESLFFFSSAKSGRRREVARAVDRGARQQCSGES